MIHDPLGIGLAERDPRAAERLRRRAPGRVDGPAIETRQFGDPAADVGAGGVERMFRPAGRRAAAPPPQVRPRPSRPCGAPTPHEAEMRRETSRSPSARVGCGRRGSRGARRRRTGRARPERPFRPVRLAFDHVEPAAARGEIVREGRERAVEPPPGRAAERPAVLRARIVDVERSAPACRPPRQAPAGRRGGSRRAARRCPRCKTFPSPHGRPRRRLSDPVIRRNGQDNGAVPQAQHPRGGYVGVMARRPFCGRKSRRKRTPCARKSRRNRHWASPARGIRGRRHRRRDAGQGRRSRRGRYRAAARARRPLQPRRIRLARLRRQRLAAEIGRCFGATPVIGCTTAGEITPNGWSEGGVVAVAGFLEASFAYRRPPDPRARQFPRRDRARARQAIARRPRRAAAGFRRTGPVRRPAGGRACSGGGSGHPSAAAGPRRDPDHRRLGRRRAQVRTDLHHSRRRGPLRRGGTGARCATDLSFRNSRADHSFPQSRWS